MNADNIKILIVDDNPTNLKVLTGALSHTGYKLLTATSGEKAISVASMATPQLVLLDINMPGIDGYETCRQLKSMPQTKEIPIIFLSALDSVESKVEGFKAGAVDYVTKPFYKEEVCARVETQLKIFNLKNELELNVKRLEDLNQEVTDSIRYTRRIQKALLPTSNDLRRLFPDSLIYWKPKQIVSGDFYHFMQLGDDVLITVADCTGHGVPGAVMSVMGIHALTMLIDERGVRTPAALLDNLDTLIQEQLNQKDDDNEVKDGMDAVICKINTQTYHMEYAGAKRPVLVIRNNELIILETDRRSVGGGQFETQPFTTNTFQLQKNDTIYLFTDGYCDQFGGDEQKKMGMKRFEQIILTINAMPEADMSAELEKQFLAWRGDLEQTDDVLILAFRI